MSSRVSKSEILDVVCREISDCLGIDLEETRPESTFFTDLSGESIDVIDLMFRLEKRLGARVELQTLLSDLEVGPDGQLTNESIRQIQTKIPEIDWTQRVAAIPTDDPRDILTPDLISELVLRAIPMTVGQIATSST